MGFALPVLQDNGDIPVHDENFPLEDMNLPELLDIIGGLSEPSKMPGYAYSISAFRCKVGNILAKVEGSTCFGCYARKGNYVRFPAIQRALERRYQSLYDRRWVAAFIRILNRRSDDVFRWHDSGDLQSVGHLHNIVKVAIGTPDIDHWLPTREYGIVDEWMREHGSFPSNLAVRMSAHINGKSAPARYELTSAVLPRGMSREEMEAAIGRKFNLCPAYTQGGVCGDCRSCWDQSVDMVVYPQH